MQRRSNISNISNISIRNMSNISIRNSNMKLNQPMRRMNAYIGGDKIDVKNKEMIIRHGPVTKCIEEALRAFSLSEYLLRRNGYMIDVHCEERMLKYWLHGDTIGSYTRDRIVYVKSCAHWYNHQYNKENGDKLFVAYNRAIQIFKK